MQTIDITIQDKDVGLYITSYSLFRTIENALRRITGYDIMVSMERNHPSRCITVLCYGEEETFFYTYAKRWEKRRLKGESIMPGERLRLKIYKREEITI